MFKAIIFDFDGVILDSEPLHYRACAGVFQKLGLELSYEEYVEKYLGLADKTIFPKFFSDRHYKVSPSEITTFIQEKTEHYHQILNQNSNLSMVEGLDKYLFHISKSISKIAICSGSTEADIELALEKLENGKLISYFKTIVSSHDVKEGKPSPEGYLLTAQKLGVLPQECLVIEDSPYGVHAAKAAGMYVVALLTSYPQNAFQSADKVIDDFKELMSDYLITQ